MSVSCQEAQQKVRGRRPGGREPRRHQRRQGGPADLRPHGGGAGGEHARVNFNSLYICS